MKRAIVLSGGGAKGAYQAGAISYLVGELERHYELVLGVSAGNLNGAVLASFPQGMEDRAAKMVVDEWMSITGNSSIYKDWAMWRKFAAIWKPSVYDATPLHNRIRSRVDPRRLRQSGKQFRAGAVSLDTGQYKMFGQDDEKIVDAVIASAAFPAMFQPVRIFSEWWTDGGVRDVTPLSEAISMGAEEIDVVVCSPKGVPREFADHPTTFDVALRAFEIMADELMENDLEATARYNSILFQPPIGPYKPILEGRRLVPINVIRPKGVLLHNSLNFDPDLIRKNIAQGVEDAKEVVRG